MSFSSLRRAQHRARPRSWMCEGGSTPQAATRRDLVQVAGAAIAAASTLSIADLNDVAVAAAVPTTRSAGVVTETGETSACVMLRLSRPWERCLLFRLYNTIY